MIHLEGVTKIYATRERLVTVYDDVTLTVPTGTFAVLLGPPRSGKTTLLNLISGFEKVSAGTVKVAGQSLQQLRGRRQDDFRQKNIGLILQHNQLIDTLTVKENLQLIAQGSPRSFSAGAVLQLVGLTAKSACLPQELSANEQQRVSIARGLVTRPQLLLCDDPVSLLDQRTAGEVLAMLRAFAIKNEVTVVLATRDTSLAAVGDLVFEIKQRRITTLKELPVSLEERAGVR